MPATNFELSDRELLSVFGQNLKMLTSGVSSISALCQVLQINRVQFNRYLSGEATPRPVILRRICRHFGVDARILTDRLEEIPSRAEDRSDTFRRRVTLEAMQPVDPSVLPDGLYAEWKYSLHSAGMIKFHVLQVRTEDGLRKVRVRSVDNLQPRIEGLKRVRRLSDSDGFAFRQGAGFAIVDRTENSMLLTMTSFKAGYDIDHRTYTGIKVSGASFVQNLSHCSTACMLELLPKKFSDLLKRIRHPREQSARDAPQHVQRILADTCRTGFVVPADTWPER